MRTFLVMQQIGVHLPMQGTWVQSLIWEDAICNAAGQLSLYVTTAKPVPQSWKAATTEPVCCSYRSLRTHSLRSQTREAAATRGPRATRKSHLLSLQLGKALVQQATKTQCHQKSK